MASLLKFEQDFSVLISSDGAGLEASCERMGVENGGVSESALRDHHKHLAKASDGALQRERPTAKMALPVLRAKA